MNATLGAGDGGVNQLARRQRALVRGQDHYDLLKLAALGSVNRHGPGRAVVGQLAAGHAAQRGSGRVTGEKCGVHAVRIGHDDTDRAVGEAGLRVVAVDDDGLVDLWGLAGCAVRVGAGKEVALDGGVEAGHADGIFTVGGKQAHAAERRQRFGGRRRVGDSSKRRLHRAGQTGPGEVTAVIAEPVQAIGGQGGIGVVRPVRGQ